MKKILFLLIFIVAIATVNAQVYNPLNYSYNGTPVNGIKIRTNLPFTHGTQMPTIIIEGYQYGNSSTIGLSLVYYIWNGAFINHKVSSYGGYTPPVKLASENGKVVIFIDDRSYFERFSVRAYAQGIAEEAAWFQGWTTADEPISGSNITDVSYQNNFAGNVFMPGNGIWNSKGEIGIGTADPKAKLDVNGSFRVWHGGNIFYTQFEAGNEINTYAANGTPNTMFLQYRGGQTNIGEGALIINGKRGNVGIGTKEPQANLQIGESTGNGQIFLGGGKGYSTIASTRSDGGLILGKNIYTRYINSNDDEKAFVGVTSGSGFSGMKLGYNGQIDFYGKAGSVNADDHANSDSNIKLRITTNGDVAIGTTDTKGCKLAVRGLIGASEIQVKDINTWPDFVFAPNYRLRPLQEVEQFIKENNHLPEIPSEAKVKEEGIAVGEMNAKLLQKIEELTLYIIEQQKQIQELKNEVKELKK